MGKAQEALKEAKNTVKKLLKIHKSATKACENFREVEAQYEKAKKAYWKYCIPNDYDNQLRNANRAVELAEIKAKEEKDLEAIAYKSNPKIKKETIKIKRLGQE